MEATSRHLMIQRMTDKSALEKYKEGISQTHRKSSHCISQTAFYTHKMH
jgi:hypothetical protein